MIIITTQFRFPVVNLLVALGHVAAPHATGCAALCLLLSLDWKWPQGSVQIPVLSMHEMCILISDKQTSVPPLKARRKVCVSAVMCMTTGVHGA